MSDTANPSCPWCSADAPADATTCPACGAAIAQRESLGDVAIPGLTAVHPGLQDLADRPLRIAGPSPTQGAASGTILAAAVIGGPIGLAALGGVAAVAAAEYAGAGRGSGDSPGDVEDVGRPSEVTLQALERLRQAESGEEPAVEPASDPWRDEPNRRQE